jgi:beta-N-acetylhexosaminidase
LDQENGGVNSLFDEDYVCQFPSAMGIAAAGRVDLAYEVSRATATEVGACGINLMLGPVLDVLSNARYQPLGVRATSDDPQEVSQYGIAAMNGIKDAGLASCGKHFPSYGNLDFLGSSLDVPIITQTLEELSLSALVPFRNAIATGRLDAMFVGGCAISNPSMNVNHACLSDQVVDELLRNELGFQGVAISECLEMEALSHDIGVQNGVVMAVEAGCDLVLLCRAYQVQLGAFNGLKLGYENGIITRERINTSLKRVLDLKAKCTDWGRALNPPGISLLSNLHPTHATLSQKAYNDSITVVRDKEKLLPLNQSMLPTDELLLLTPLVKPLPATALTKSLQAKGGSASTVHDKWAHRDRGAIMSGEGVFRELGRALARARRGKLLHTSYTPNGVGPGWSSQHPICYCPFLVADSRIVHENLINRASCVIIVTAEANRNLYQAGFTKHIDMMCSMARSRGEKKSLVVISVSSPYDFAMDKRIGTYICTFDFTEPAMEAIVRALYGGFVPQGSLPGTLRKSKKAMKSRQHWLVEEYNRERDGFGLEELIKAVARGGAHEYRYLETTKAAAFELSNPRVQEAHFVVRNSSTQALYGFVATYAVHEVGIIGSIFVDPGKRNVSIGRSLHRRAMRSLVHRPACKRVQLGTVFPAVFVGLPAHQGSAELRSWFANGGWDAQFPKRLAALTLTDVARWPVPEGLWQGIRQAGLGFDLIVDGHADGGGVLAYVRAHSDPDVVELYAAAVRDPACSLVRARGPGDAMLGVFVECRPGSALAAFVPQLRQQGDGVGGILAPLLSPGIAQPALVLQGLALAAIRRYQASKISKVVVGWVSSSSSPILQL